jgi:hypothetical protein
MLKEKNNLIISLLIASTNNNNLLWSEYNPTDARRNYMRQMSATGEDGTKYEIEVKYSLVGDVFRLESTPSLWLRNNNLPNGMYMISTFNTDDGLLVSLRDLVKETYCKDLNPTSQLIEDTLDVISKGISTSEYRENKLNQIL